MRPMPSWASSVSRALVLALAGCGPTGTTESSEPAAPGLAEEGAPCDSPWTTLRCQSLETGQVDGLGEVCAVGERRCVDGLWGPCEEVEWVPAEPAGAAADGELREALLGSAALCGGCDPTCFVTRDCPSSADATDPRLELEGVRFDGEAGGFVIGQPSKAARGRYAWVASYGANVLNKLDMETLRNVGVYRVGRNPSRTTLDGMGNVYVGNRDSGDVTKVAGSLSQCVERNGIPGIQTSVGERTAGARDWDLLGPITDPLRGDECIVWQRLAGPTAGSPKGLAIDARGRLWVGLNDKRVYYVLDTATGNTIHGPINVGHAVYGCAIAPDGRLWSAAKDGTIRSIDTTVAAPSDKNLGPFIRSPGGVYGITVDGLNRVFVADDRELSRYDPATGTWAMGRTDGAKGLSVDADGHLYVAGHGSDAIIEHDSESLAELRRWRVVDSPRGCAPDFWNRVWGANHGSADCAVVDVATGGVTYLNTYGANYTYSDFTGFGYAMFTNPMGHFTRLYDSMESCGPYPLNKSFRARVHLEVETPDSTSVQLWGRAAATAAGLESTVEVLLGVIPPSTTRGLEVSTRLAAAGQDGRARFLEIRVALLRNGSSSSPVLRTITLEEYCE